MNWDNITKALAKIGYSGDMTLEVVGYMEGFENELLFDALCFASKVAHKLAEKVEAALHEGC